MKRLLELAERFAHHMSFREPVPHAEAGELLTRISSAEVTDSEKVEVIRLLNPVLLRSNWARFVWEHQLGATGKSLEEIDDLWLAKMAGKQANEEQRDTELDEFSRKHKESFEHDQKINEWIRRLEVESGADTRRVDEICKSIGTLRNGLPEEDLPTRLRRQLLGAHSNESADDNYDRAQHELLYKILAGLGSALRSQREIVTLCGDILDELFPDESSECCISFSLCQEMFLLEDFVAENPEDPIGIAWLAEMKAHEVGDEDEAFRLAEELWHLSGDLQAERLDQAF